MKRNKDYRAMNCLARGLWHQLLLECKDQDDNGYVVANSWRNLATIFRINKDTCLKLCEKWSRDNLISIEKTNGGIDIHIHNYHKWQQATVSDVRGYVENSGEKSPPPKNKKSLPDQTRANQTKPKQTKPPSDKSDHKKVIEYFCKKHEECLGVKYEVQGAKDGAIVKKLTRHSLADIKARIDTLFNSPKKFYNNNRTLGILSACWNQLSQEGGGRGTVTEGDREYEPVGQVFENRDNPKNSQT